jgi:hypothetical protein
MLLIHPPVTKPSEPPAGIARLSGALSSQGVKHCILDLNLECLLALLSDQTGMSDTWTTRAKRNLSKNIDTLRTWRGYTSFDRYRRAVADLHRLFQVHVASHGSRLTTPIFLPSGATTFSRPQRILRKIFSFPILVIV